MMTSRKCRANALLALCPHPLAHPTTLRRIHAAGGGGSSRRRGVVVAGEEEEEETGPAVVRSDHLSLSTFDGGPTEKVHTIQQRLRVYV